MASPIIGIPAYNAQTPLTSGDRVTPDAHRSLLQVYNAAVLIPVSTANGGQLIKVPFAKFNQGQKRTYKKTSNDANVVMLIASGADQIEFAGSLTVATAQGSHVTIQSDGASNWYVVA